MQGLYVASPQVPRLFLKITHRVSLDLEIDFSEPTHHKILMRIESLCGSNHYFYSKVFFRGLSISFCIHTQQQQKRVHVTQCCYWMFPVCASVFKIASSASSSFLRKSKGMATHVPTIPKCFLEQILTTCLARITVCKIIEHRGENPRQRAGVN